MGRGVAVGRPGSGQVAADSIGSDEEGRLDDAILALLRSPVFEIDDGGADRPPPRRAVDLSPKPGSRTPAFFLGDEILRAPNSTKRRYEILMSGRRPIDALEWESERARRGRGGAKPAPPWLRTKGQLDRGAAPARSCSASSQKRILDSAGGLERLLIPEERPLGRVSKDENPGPHGFETGRKGASSP